MIGKQILLHMKTVSLTQKQQHLQFQNYLMKEKEEVSQKLKNKVLPTTTVEDYDFFKVLGKGSYGRVVAAQNIRNEKLVAVKVIKKKSLANKEILKHLISEIKILSAINFEFLISLECYFTNKCSVFVVLPYIAGGHFFNLLRKVKKFEEEPARFFAGQVVLAIEYLHYMDIVFRDLKPENLLIDLQGYLKLVDFGFSKHTGHSYCYTFCGTPEYMAPEILLSKGYNQSPDWWTLGILLYEMCNGSPPFTSRNELKLFEKIIGGSIQWPEHFSSDLKTLIQGLLQVDRTRRLGCMKNKVEDIKFHKWFSSLDWIALWKKKIIPPVMLPRPNQITETMNNENVINYSFINCKNHTPFDIGNIDISVYCFVPIKK